MIRRFAMLLAATGGAIWLALSPTSAWAEKRVALVIGNSTYQAVNKLPNPARDATAIAKMLKQAGFEKVETLVDVGNLEFKRGIRRFEDTAADADIAVVFYAGHGIEIGGTNYLIPTDATLASDRDAQDEAITLDRLVSSADGAKKLRVVILDACRDNPFTGKMRRDSRAAAQRGVQSGLTRVDPSTTDTLIAYAAKAGSTAEDGDGDHSPFTAALLKDLTVPGRDIRLAFGYVKDSVMKATSGRQEPFVYGSLGGGIYSLVPAPPEAPSGSSVADAKADYELVAKIGSRKAWEVYLATYKTGFYADLARAQLAALPADVQLASLGPPTTVPASRPPTTREALDWDRIKNTTDQAALQNFIRRYPDSPLAITAQDRLNVLVNAQRERDEQARLTREDAERKRAELAATRQREEDERRARVAEAAQKAKAEEAARQAAEAERRAEEAERQAAEAKRRAEEAAIRQAEDARRKAEEAERRTVENKRKAEEAAARQAAEAKRKVEEAERAKAAAEAARLREESALAAKEAEAERQRAAAAAAAEAARVRAETERAVKAAEADQQKKAAAAAAEVAKAREESERAAKAAESERQKVAAAAALEATCRQEGEQLAALQAKGSAGTGVDDLARFVKTMSCDRIKPQAMAALNTFNAELAKRHAELVRSAQTELTRIGCYTGSADGNMSEATKNALSRYLSAKGVPSGEPTITDDLVSSLRKQQPITCLRTCPSGQSLSGDTCIAAARPGTPSQSAGRKTTEPARKQATREQPTSRPVAPRATQQAAIPRASGGHSGGGHAPMVGVGF